jgi:hypothetical protein
VFRSLINDAKSAAGAVLARYAVRASVAVPFLVAAGFGTAALTVILVERYGPLIAYCMMAAGFAAVGVVAALIVTVKEQEEEVAEASAEQNDTAQVSTEAAAQAAVQLPIALLGTLLTSPAGPGAAAGGLKVIGRNWPLVLMLVLVGLLFWPIDNKEGVEEAAADREADKDLETPQPEPDAPVPAEAATWRANGMDRHHAA